MRRALVIEGGGVRGAFTAGAVNELWRHGAAAFDDIFAVSAGAPTAAYLVSEQAEEGTAIWGEYIHGDQLIALKNLARGVPLMDIDRLVGVFRDIVPLDTTRLGAAPARVHIGVTHAATGAGAHVRVTAANAFALLQATMALPVAYGRTVDVDGVACVDGGIASPIPLAPALALGADETVLVLTQPRGYRRRPGAVTSWLTGWSYPRHPALRRALAARNAVGNAVLEEVERLEEEGRVTVIRPLAALPVARLNRDRAAIVATIEAGRVAARDWIARTGWEARRAAPALRVAG